MAMAVLADHLEIGCESCGAKVVAGPLERTTRCPYCDSAAVIDRPATSDRPDPVFAIGFAVDRAQAGRLVLSYLKGRKMGPFGLARAAAENVRGIYVPAYLYSALAVSGYRARIGEHYWVDEVTTGSNGKSRVRRRQKTEVRNLFGPHRIYLADVLVTASRGITNDELEAIEPFDLGGLRRYTPGLVAGWISEEPSLSRDDCLGLARGEGTREVGRMLRSFMPGDSLLGLDYRTELAAESADLTLVPVWVFAMRYAADKPPVRVLVNGQSGAVAGRVPTSWAKVGLVAGAVFAVIALAVLLISILGVMG
jgi:hypothetical protein